MRFKGLCRTCTEYGKDGEILTPVSRIRIDEFGNEYVPKKAQVTRVTREMMLNARKQSRKLTKKQKAAAQAQLKAEMEAIKAAQADAHINDDGIMEFGEEVGHIHNEDCNHEEE